MSELKKGDVVKLKSGSPAMTIQGIGNDNARCAWFDGTQNKDANFAVEALDVIKETERLNFAELGQKLA